ncbi:hypothetical protein [Streptomyces sp. NBC_00588]|uniref:hypothetical protein n=1 Tax=Streptomyces sp. NBC_00588 TaxID=2975784 RepID=UPI002E7FFFD6|nr:hypothetical protein [Streptomyces sp. NBC_00588]WUB35230.1 hypothetical protein OHN38_10025 [Streptomyces sp. NBC_00588]
MAQWRPGQRAAWDGPGGAGDGGEDGGAAARPPLPDLPCFPAMHGYTKLREDLAALKFRHVADALRPPPAPGRTAFGATPRPADDDAFRVLDGLWFRGRGTRWVRVDEEYVRQVRAGWQAGGDPRADGAVALADTLEAYARHDPMGLRRLLLWQLACLLRDADTGPTEKAAQDLGVHPDEAGYLAAAVALGFPEDGPARETAERLGDLWPDRRLRRAEKAAAQVPDTGRDHVLARLLDEVRAQRAAVHQLLDRAARLEAGGSVRAAVKARFEAVRRAGDDPAVEAGLLGAAARAADVLDASDPGPHLDVVVEKRTVRLTWPPPRPGVEPVTFRVVRFPDGTPADLTELAVLGGEQASVPLRHSEEDAPVGRAVRYAVVPLRQDMVAGVPLASEAVVIAPDVTGVSVSLVPDGVRLRWRADPACAEVQVERRAQEATNVWADPVECERDGLRDVPLAAGSYLYEIRCAYPGPEGGTVWSEGVQVPVRAEEWPDQVEDLVGRLVGDGDRVALTWRPPQQGLSTVVSWPSGPVRPGTDVSRRTDRTAPPPPAAPEPSVEVAVPERSRVRMTALSTLGDRALTGPAVVVERPGTVRDLTAHRISVDRAAVRFEWPEPAVLVLVAWEGGGRREERRVARSRFLAEGHVAFPVTADAYRVTVAAVPRPDALAVPADAASAHLPAVPVPPRLLPPGQQPAYTWRYRWRRWWPFGR